MSTNRRSQAERRESTRRRLLDAASRVFASKGYREATVLDIVTEAGVSTGALYNHFPGKREVFLAVFDERFTDWSASYNAAVAPSDDADAALSNAAHHYEALLRERPVDAQLLIEFWSAAMRDESLRPAFIERHAQIRDAMAALIERMQTNLGITLSAPAASLGAIVTALADGLAIQRLIEPALHPPSNEELLLTALRLLLAGAAGTAAEPTTRSRGVDEFKIQEQRDTSPTASADLHD